MGNSFYLHAAKPKCPHCKKEVELPDYRSLAYDLDMDYTYNVSPMFREALGKEGVNFIRQQVCSSVLPKLKEGVTAMRGDPDKYKAMNPDNGWGDTNRVGREIPRRNLHSKLNNC